MPGGFRKVRRAFLASLLLLLVTPPALAEDSYLLALSWQPGFCAERATKTECKIAAKDEPRFVLHGLWPDWDVNRDGKRGSGDDFCVAGESQRRMLLRLDTDNWLMLPPVDLSVLGSAALAEAMPGIVVGLDRHEWWKHGSCSGLEAEDYFAASVALLREVERGFLARLLIKKAGTTVKRQLLLDAFENDFGRGSAKALTLDCSKDDDGVTALQEIRIRLRRSGIAQGLSADSLSIPAKPGRGDCAAAVFVPGWPR